MFLLLSHLYDSFKALSVCLVNQNSRKSFVLQWNTWTNVQMYIVHEKMAGNFNMQLHSLCKTFEMVTRWVLTDYIYIVKLITGITQSPERSVNTFVCFFFASVFHCFERQSATFYLVIIWMPLFSCILYIKATVKQWVNITGH